MKNEGILLPRPFPPLFWPWLVMRLLCCAVPFRRCADIWMFRVHGRECRLLGSGHDLMRGLLGVHARHKRPRHGSRTKRLRHADEAVVFIFSSWAVDHLTRLTTRTPDSEHGRQLTDHIIRFWSMRNLSNAVLMTNPRDSI